MKASHTASVARSPSTARHGSPGIRRAVVNTTNTIPNRTGMLSNNRRMTKRLIDRWCPQEGSPGSEEGRRGCDAPLFRNEWPRSARRRRVEVAAEEAGPVLEVAGVADVEWALGVPLSREAGDHVVGIERRAVVELHTIAEGACPRLEVRAGLALRRQRGNCLRAADL